jgi:hypothetical protein
VHPGPDPSFSRTRNRATRRASFSSDNPLDAFVAFLAEHTRVGERSARLYVAHLQRFAAWLQ